MTTLKQRLEAKAVKQGYGQSVADLHEIIGKLAGALEFYGNYMDGNNPEFMKSGWQKYPSPQEAKEALVALEEYLGDGK